MIERSTNYRRIKKLVEWPLIISIKIIYLIESLNGIDKGIWSFEPWGEGMKIHADMQSNFRGKQAIESGKEAFRWIFQNTNADFIYAGILRENMKACHAAAKSGMTNLGVKDNIREFKITR